MKITFVIPSYNKSGGVRVPAIYADRLRRRGHEVFIVGRPPRRIRLRSRLRSLLEGRGWPRTPPPTLSYFEGLDLRCHVLDDYRPVAETDVPDADVSIATWWETAEWIAGFGPMKGKKVYFVQNHEADPLIARTSVERAESTYRLPFHLITISRWLTELLRSRYGHEQVDLVPNSVDTKQFCAPARGRQTRPTIGFLYAPYPVKGIDVTLNALERLLATFPTLEVVAFGQEPLAVPAWLSERTSFHRDPPQDQIRDLYARCDVWLCGSRLEGFHLPPLEAMACRCPVVSTRVGGPEDVIEEGVNGHLVEIEDVEGLARQLTRVLSLSESEWQAMSDAAYRTATRYTWDDATDLFEAELQAAIGQSDGQGDRS